MLKGYVILLRGFNTGRIILEKSKLGDMIEKVGYHNYQIILGTGNIIIDTEKDKEDVLHDILSELTVYFGQPIFGHIRTIEEILNLESYFKDQKDDLQHYILFTVQETADELLDIFHDIDDGFESVEQIGEDLYWTTPKGYTLNGFGKLALGHRKYKKLVTSRNVNTVKKIIEGIKNA